MREHRALRGAGRARGEEDHGRVLRNDDGVGTTGGPGEQELVRKTFEAGNSPLAEDDDPLQRLEPGGDPLDALQPLAVDHEQPTAAGVQHVHEHVAAEPGVQRHLDEARARDAEPEPEVLGPVAEHHRDPVTLDEPEAGERVRNAVRGPVEAPVGHRLVLEADDLAVGLLLGPRREDRADRPLTVVHGAPFARPSRHRLELAERLGPALAGLEPPHRVRVDLFPQQPDRLRRRRLGDGHERRGVEREAAACDGFVARHARVDRGEPEPLAVPVEDGRRGDDRGDAPRARR